MNYVNWNDRKELTTDLKPIYAADSETTVELALETFERKWETRYPMIGQLWRNNWERVSSFFSFPREIRKALYTTNAIESINSQLRKVLRNRGHFPTDEAVMKLLYLALTNAEKKWTRPIRQWRSALQQLAIQFEGRLPV